MRILGRASATALLLGAGWALCACAGPRLLGAPEDAAVAARVRPSEVVVEPSSPWRSGSASGAAVAGGCPLPGDGCLHVAVVPRFRWGTVSGSLQTGKGGQPGTTSPGRPTLGEIGVTDAQEAGAELLLSWRRHEVSLDGSVLFLFGDAVLSEGLVSQAQTYPAGTSVDSGTWIGLARLAYRYRLDLPLGSTDRLVVKPGLGAMGMKLQYTLEGSNGAKTDRAHSHVAPHAEVGLEWRPGLRGPVWLSADARQTLYWFLGDSNQTDLFEGTVALHYDLARNWTLRLEAGYRHIGFKDAQTVPNDIDVDFGPFFGVGLSAHW